MDGSAVATTAGTMLDFESPEAIKLIKDIGIPPCPAVLVEVMSETRKDEPDFRRLSHLINKDVALSASVLKTINSPFYGLARKARTVHDALALLGLKNTTRLVAGMLLRNAFATSESPYMYEFWDSSGRIALITAYLARELQVAKLDEAHTFALFRDCGVPVMLTRFADFGELLAATKKASERVRIEEERKRYNIDHAWLGAGLARSWHLPVETWNAILTHGMYTDLALETNKLHIAAAPLIALSLLAEQLYRIHRGTFVADNWVNEDAFVTRILGAVNERLEPLANDIGRLLEQS
jgi:HD-like signal output (HDOD) protein